MPPRHSDPELQEKLADHYRSVFNSESGRQVLSDILHESRFFVVPPPGTAPEDRAYADGARALMAHILQHLHRTDEEMRILHAAARRLRLIEDDQI